MTYTDSLSLEGLPSKLYLWEERTLYLGVFSRPIQLIQPASSICFSLGEGVSISSKAHRNAVTVRSFILPPGEWITADTLGAPVAICMLDPLGYDYARMQPHMQCSQGAIHYNIKNEAHYIDTFTALYQHEKTSDDVYPILDQLLHHDMSGHTHTVDPRMSQVLKSIQDNVQSNLPIEFFAQQIGVSVPRLVQLFKEQIGVPMRRYRLWHRLFCAIQEIARTQNLSAGAFAAGFSDSAHFNRTFKRMVGLTPMEMLAQENGLTIYTDTKKPIN